MPGFTPLRDGGGTMLVGYARTSTAEQEAGLEAKARNLHAGRVERRGGTAYLYDERGRPTGRTELPSRRR